MSEASALLAETADRVLRGGCAWPQIADAGLPSVLVTQERGGFGGRWEDTLIILKACGRHATPLPLPEAILASRLADDANLSLSGMATVSPHTNGEIVNGHFTGDVKNVPWGSEAAQIVCVVENTIFLLNRADAAEISEHKNPAGEPRDTLRFESAPALAAPCKGWDEDRLFHHCALLRVGQMAGTLERALELSVAYTRERQQFGKPLAAFQAIQQQLAVLAEETAAAGMAAAAACKAADRGDAAFEIAAAKLRANMAARAATGIAHQVHGAMGFTAEYPLHHLTRRLWSWQSEFGNERYWAELLGSQIARRGADNFWNDLVDRA
jgi:acyl-CoA dehydrogenase